MASSGSFSGRCLSQWRDRPGFSPGSLLAGPPVLTAGGEDGRNRTTHEPDRIIVCFGECVKGLATRTGIEAGSALHEQARYTHHRHHVKKGGYQGVLRGALLSLGFGF